MSARRNIRIKRVYKPVEKADGFRVLVDRVWPRGISKEKAAVDLWMKEIGPSTELRKWFGHGPSAGRSFGRGIGKSSTKSRSWLMNCADMRRRGR